MIYVQPAATLDVQVVWADRGVAADQVVEVIDAGAVPPASTLRDDALDVSGPLFWTLEGSTSIYVPPESKAVIVDKGQTDSMGRVRLRANGRKNVVFVAVSGFGHPLVLRKQPITRGAESSVTITLSRGVTIRGSIGPEAVRALDPLVQIRVDGNVYRGPRGLGCFPVDAKGLFEISGAPSGNCALYVATRPYKEYVVCGSPLSRIRLSDGDDVSVHLDASDCMPGRIEGQAFVNGSPWNGWIRLHRFVDGKLDRGYLRRMRVDTDGHLAMHDVAPGEYRIVGLCGEGLGAEPFVFSEPVIVQAGRTSTMSFRRDIEDVVLEIAGSDGVLADHYCTVWVGETRAGALARHLNTDQSGQLALGCLPLGSIHVESTVSGIRCVGEVQGPPYPAQLVLSEAK